MRQPTPPAVRDPAERGALKVSFTETSTVGTAKKGIDSVRATIPNAVAQALGVEDGDKLLWTVTVQDSEFRVGVRKKTKEA